MSESRLPVAVTRVMLRSSSSILPKQARVCSLALWRSACSCWPLLDVCSQRQAAWPNTLPCLTACNPRKRPTSSLYLVARAAPPSISPCRMRRPSAGPPEFHTPCLASSTSPENVPNPTQRLGPMGGTYNTIWSMGARHLMCRQPLMASTTNPPAPPPPGLHCPTSPSSCGRGVQWAGSPTFC